MMDFDEIVVKESPGLCRCCLSEGCYKDLGSEYSWMSETEIYADMLLECFDISISQHATGPNGSNRLICEVCITRLRDACNFKKQVLESEKKFVDMVGRGEFRPKVLLYQTQMKTEITMDLEEETGADDAEVEYLEEDVDFVDEDLKNEDYGEASVSEDITVSALAVKGKRGRPKKSSTAVKPEKKAKVPKLEDKPTKSKAVAKVENMSSSDSEDDVKPPLDILNAAMITTSNLLPEKSRAKYEKAYKDFLDWRINKRMTSMSENVLLAYFEELSMKFSSATLWTTYSMVKSMVNIKHQVDISKYSKLTTFLKQKAEGYQAKKAKTFSPEEIIKFLNEAPDQFYLQSKVALIFGVMGACRRQELYNLQFSDVHIVDKTIFVTVRNTKPKTDRTFTVTGSYCGLCKKYMELRPKNSPTSNFFLNYYSGRCTSQKIGINKFGALGKTIAKYLNLPDPEMYTGHCFRRTSATLLIGAGGDILTLKRHRGWRSTTVAEEYIDESMINTINVSNQIVNSIQNKEININMPSSSSTSNQDPDTAKPSRPLNISHCPSVNVHYNYYNK